MGEGLIGMIMIISGLSFCYGAFTVNEPKEGSCQYKSVIEYIALPYVAGCELFRTRWGAK